MNRNFSCYYDRKFARKRRLNKGEFFIKIYWWNFTRTVFRIVYSCSFIILEMCLFLFIHSPMAGTNFVITLFLCFHSQIFVCFIYLWHFLTIFFSTTIPLQIGNKNILAYQLTGACYSQVFKIFRFSMNMYMKDQHFIFCFNRKRMKSLLWLRKLWLEIYQVMRTKTMVKIVL